MAGHRRQQLRFLGGEAEPDPRDVVRYTNRHGHTYYLHEGVTRSGKPRYFVRRTISEGACTHLPAEFEFAESINGAVSVRRVRDPSPIPDADVERVRAELERHEHLRDYAAEPRDEGIVVFEPEYVGFAPAAVASMGDDVRRMLRELAIIPSHPIRPRRYRPVMRFAPAIPHGPGEEYVLMRMTWRGEGGWKQIDGGPLEELLRYLRVLGSDEFFQLD